MQKMLKRFCSDQVCMVLERMESHPEEFTGNTTNGRYHKWDFVFTTGTFNKVEKLLLKHKLKELRKEVTRQQIILTLMYDAQDDESTLMPYHPTMSTTSRFDPEPSKVKKILDAFNEQKKKELQNKMIVNKTQMEMLRKATKNDYHR